MKELRWMLLAVVIVFTIMLVFNFLTHYVVDDYAYMYSWRDGARITNVLQIFPSMASHYSIMNGRIVAHFMAQLFLLLPHTLFRFVNAGMFTFLICLIYYIANRKNKHNPFFVFLIFGLIFLFQKAFGQVNLWLDGSCNYLWCAVFNMLFLCPYILKFQDDKEIKGWISRALFVISGFFVGCYGENASLATLIMILLFLGLSVGLKKQRIKPYLMLAVITYFIGFMIMMKAPATARNKLGDVGLMALFEGFYSALYMLYEFRILVVSFGVLFAIGCIRKIELDKMLLASIFMLGSLAANFVMMFGKWYDYRSACVPLIFLVTACVVLFVEVFKTNYKELCVFVCVVVLLFTTYYGMIAFNDIFLTHLELQENEMKIVECRDAGIMDIALKSITPDTQYCPVWNLRYLHPSDPTTWPNESMARYYGVNSLVLEE